MASTEEEVFYVTRYAEMNSDLTPWNFFLWGYVKDIVFIPPMPIYIPDLLDRITQTVRAIT
jgi:hypothetical protein